MFAQVSLEDADVRGSAGRAYVVGALVDAGSAPARVAQNLVTGSFGEGDLADLPRLDPLHVTRVLGGHWGGTQLPGVKIRTIDNLRAAN